MDSYGRGVNNIWRQYHCVMILIFDQRILQTLEKEGVIWVIRYHYFINTLKRYPVLTWSLEQQSLNHWRYLNVKNFQVDVILILGGRIIFSVTVSFSTFWNCPHRCAVYQRLVSGQNAKYPGDQHIVYEKCVVRAPPPPPRLPSPMPLPIDIVTL